MIYFVIPEKIFANAYVRNSLNALIRFYIATAKVGTDTAKITI